MYKAYKCENCGHINVFKSYKIDGIRCVRCEGNLICLGDCTAEKDKDVSIKIGCDTSEIDKAIKRVNLLNNNLLNVEVSLNKLNINLKNLDGKYRNIKDILDDLTMVLSKHN